MEIKWNVSGLIVEGISGSGKTSILSELLKSERFVNKSYLSSIVLSEHQTQRILERKEREEGLSVQDNLSLLDEHISYFENLNNQLNRMQWCRSNQTSMRIPYILERFHFTHVYHYNHMGWGDVQEIDNRLSAVNCKVCLLTADPEALRSRLLTGRDSSWMNYLKRYGDTDDKIVKYFVEQQSSLIELSRKSELQTLIIDTSGSSPDDNIDMILDFWGAV